TSEYITPASRPPIRTSKKNVICLHRKSRRKGAKSAKDAEENKREPGNQNYLPRTEFRHPTRILHFRSPFFAAFALFAPLRRGVALQCATPR
ncbi:MAG: hypothetical protein ABI771_15465, partial [Betaproteobacteria bacterium]